MKLVADIQTSRRHAQAALFTPDGGEMITVGLDPAVKVWSVPSFELARMLEGHDKSVNGLALSSDGKTLVTGSTDKTVCVWDYRSGELLRTLKGHRNTVVAAKISPDDEWIATSSYDGTIRLWPMSGDGDAVVLKDRPKNVTSVAFAADGRTMASAGLGSDILLWDMSTHEIADKLDGGLTAFGSLHFDPSGEHLWSLGNEGTIHVRSTADWSVEQTIAVR